MTQEQQDHLEGLLKFVKGLSKDPSTGHLRFKKSELYSAELYDAITEGLKEYEAANSSQSEPQPQPMELPDMMNVLLEWGFDGVIKLPADYYTKYDNWADALLAAKSTEDACSVSTKEAQLNAATLEKWKNSLRGNQADTTKIAMELVKHLQQANLIPPAGPEATPEVMQEKVKAACTGLDHAELNVVVYCALSQAAP